MKKYYRVLLILSCICLYGCHKSKEGLYVVPANSYPGWRHPLPVPYLAGLEPRPFQQSQNSRWGRLPARSVDAASGWRRLAEVGKDRTETRDASEIIGKIRVGEEMWSLTLDKSAPSGIRLDVWDMQGKLLQSSLLKRVQ